MGLNSSTERFRPGFWFTLVSASVSRLKSAGAFNNIILGLISLGDLICPACFRFEFRFIIFLACSGVLVTMTIFPLFSFIDLICKPFSTGLIKFMIDFFGSAVFFISSLSSITTTLSELSVLVERRICFLIVFFTMSFLDCIGGVEPAIFE